MLENCQKGLVRISSGLDHSANWTVNDNALSRLLALEMLKSIRAIEVHDMWVAGCLLHPRLRSLSFIGESVKREHLKAKGVDFIRRMLDSVQMLEKDSSSTENSSKRPDKRRRIATERSTVGKFSLADMLDCPEPPSRCLGEVKRYMEDAFESLDTDDLMRSDEMEVVRFWLYNSKNCSFLKKVAFRGYAKPASSCSSERDFSCVNRIITASALE